MSRSARMAPARPKPSVRRIATVGAVASAAADNRVHPVSAVDSQGSSPEPTSPTGSGTGRPTWSRRRFLASTAAIASAASAASATRGLAASDDRPLRFGVIGVANRAASNLRGVSSQTISALCDVDARYLEAAGKEFPEARLYRDYRELLESESELDGVVISTPDHHHAPAAMRAIRRGLAVYCEKPLTHTVAEARALTLAAREAGVATQMGTQIHATDNYRRVVEKIRGGIVGNVRRVHVWVGKGWAADAMPGPSGDAAPESLAWDLWLGPAPDVDYTPGLHPAQWRRYRPYGTGTLGDMGCHYMDLPFWALQLRSPDRVAAEGPEPHPDACPHGLRVRYRFAATDHHDDLELVWHDGNLAADFVRDSGLPGSGVLFEGDRGKLVATYGSHSLVDGAGPGVTPTIDPIPASIGHYEEWMAAIRGGDPALCHFDYAGPLTECVLLGTVAHQAGRPIRWDGDRAEVIADDEAQRFIGKSYRDGWQLAGG